MKKVALSLLMMIFTQLVYSYEIKTHQQLTQIASEKSTIGNNIVFGKLGLPNISILETSEVEFSNSGNLYSINYFSNSKGGNSTIYQLLQDGVDFEDALGFEIIGFNPLEDFPFIENTFDPTLGYFRVFNHFYDPQNGGASFVLGNTSPDWILEDEGEKFGIGEIISLTPYQFVYDMPQHYSYGHARDYFYRALTESEKSVRDQNFGLTFQSIGHVVHHIQDMGQPQHVRNDLHLPIAKDFVEKYVLKKYSKERFEDLIAESYYGGIDSILLPRVRDYWDWENNTNDDGQSRIGNAEFTSANFVSWDTNFLWNPSIAEPTDDYPLPLPDTAQVTTVPVTDLDCTNCSNLSGNVTFIGSTVNDGYSTQSIPNSRASTYSIFQPEYENGLIQPGLIRHAGFTLNQYNFDERLKYVIPRSVAFSTGMIDYFFRGEMQISLPEEGVYALKDFSVAHSIGLEGKTYLDSDPNKVFGFEKIRLNLRNTTPSIDLPDHAPFDVPPYNQPIAQQLFEGTLEAVVKYSLNHCYLSNGSGGFGMASLSSPNSVVLDNDLAGLSTPSNCSGSKYFSGLEAVPNDDLTLNIRRRAYEQIAKSAPLTVGPQVDADIDEVPSDQPVLLTFDFSGDPIPVNATDVRLQVVYRGKLGPKDELPTGVPTLVEADAVVVTTKDISEPSDVTVTNLFDYGVNAPSYAWLSMTTDSGQSGLLPQNYTVTVDPEYLTPGTYEYYINGGNIPGNNSHATHLKVELTVPSRYEWQDASTLPLEGRVLSNEEINWTLYPQDAEGDGVGLVLDGEILSNDGSAYEYTLSSQSLSEGSHTLETIVFYQGKNRSFKTDFVVHNNTNNTAPQFGTLADITQDFIGSGPEAGMASVEVPLGITDIENTILASQISLSPRIANDFAEIQGDASNGFTVHFYSLDELAALNGSGDHVSPGVGIDLDIIVTITDGELETAETFRFNRTRDGIVPTTFTPRVLQVTSDVLTSSAVVHNVDGSLTNISAPIDEVYDYSLGSGDDAFDIALGEGIKSTVDLNTQLSDERAAANAVYANLGDDSLLKKIIDTNRGSMPIADYDPQLSETVNKNNGYLVDTANNQSYTLIHGLDTSGEPLAQIEVITSADTARVGYLSDYEESFTMYAHTPDGGVIGTVDQCGGIRPERRQWSEVLQRYRYSGLAFKVGNLYSQARHAGEAICEMGIFSIGNQNLISYDALNDTLEADPFAAEALINKPDVVTIHSLY